MCNVNIWNKTHYCILHRPLSKWFFILEQENNVSIGLNWLVTFSWNKRFRRSVSPCINQPSSNLYAFKKMLIIFCLLVFRLTQNLQPQLRLLSWLEVTQSAKSLFALVIWSVLRWCELLTSTTTIELFKPW